MYDLHLHTTCSDGDLSVAALVDELRQRGIAGFSVTDHNGVWGVQEAVTLGRQAGLDCLEGIEVSALFNSVDVHVLGYSRHFVDRVLQEGLAQTRAGYEKRTKTMVALCQQQGYDQISFAAIAKSRAGQANPSYISYDVARELQRHYGLSSAEARSLTVAGGACYVPYGDWALSLPEVVALLHEAQGVAVLAHPGIIAQEAGVAIMHEVLTELVTAGLDGIEVYHPFHSASLRQDLTALAQEHHLLITGGSDWHGPGRYHDEDFGRVGIDEAAWQQLLDRLP